MQLHHDYELQKQNMRKHIMKYGEQKWQQSNTKSFLCEDRWQAYCDIGNPMSRLHFSTAAQSN
jgi:hypothetical protein